MNSSAKSDATSQPVHLLLDYESTNIVTFWIRFVVVVAIDDDYLFFNFQTILNYS